VTKPRLLLLAGLLALGSRSGAQISVQSGGSLRIEGDSTLHKWSSTATVVAMTFQLMDGAPASLTEAIKASKVKSMEVSIPVAGLKSGDSGLDRNLRNAMKEKKFPNVVYRLVRYETAKGAGEGIVPANTAGELTIAGRTRTVTMDVVFRLSPDGASVSGSCPLNMSDYGIEPPKLLLGAIKVRDPITIRFDLFLKPDDARTKP
jgi:polyisoprenoid-binding protein YceI